MKTTVITIQQIKNLKHNEKPANEDFALMVAGMSEDLVTIANKLNETIAVVNALHAKQAGVDNE